MKQLLFTVVLGSILAPVAYAQGDVYLCVDANGKKEYKNTGSTKGCKVVDLPRMTVVPAPAKKVASKSASTPSNFPKVDEDTQRSRDSDRKQILTDELKVEEKKLDALKKEYNSGEPERRPEERMAYKYVERVNNLKEDIARTEKNIDALKREISNLK